LKYDFPTFFQHGMMVVDMQGNHDTEKERFHNADQSFA